MASLRSAQRYSSALALALVYFATPTPGQAAPSLYAPAAGAVVLGSETVVDVRGCARRAGDLQASLDGQPLPLDWSRGPYAGQWIARLKLPRPGGHTLSFEGRCRASASFLSRGRGTRDVAASLAAHYEAHHSPTSLAWSWGPAVFLYGLARLDPRSTYLHDYYEHWAARGIAAPNKSDDCPAAAAGLALWRDRSDPVSAAELLTVADYIAHEPRNTLGAIDHLGHSFLRTFYADSIWVDSLMMLGVFGAQWGRFARDERLLDWAARQPGIYASVLQDPESGLFRHAWQVNRRRAIPSSRTFWLRGNGWVLTSIVEILEELPADSPRRAELLGILSRVVEGLKPFQQPTGLWDSIANAPGASYGETSGTMLVAYAVARAAHRGWLPRSQLEVAKRAFASVTARLRATADGYSMPRISWFTNPGSRLAYQLTPAVSDMSYGVGAYLLAAAELDSEEF